MKRMNKTVDETVDRQKQLDSDSAKKEAHDVLPRYPLNGHDEQALRIVVLTARVRSCSLKTIARDGTEQTNKSIQGYIMDVPLLLRCVQ